jgi:predicted nucleotidyltransferase component of viral defense system
MFLGIKALKSLEKDKAFDILVLYGGTAINKIYFEKYQRISEDIDLMYAAKENKIKAQHYVETIRKIEPTLLVDLTKHTFYEKPVTCSAKSLFYFTGVDDAVATVKSFSFEYLLAMKTHAFLGRKHLEEKDIFDLYTGFGLGKLKIIMNLNKYLKYFKLLISDNEHFNNLTVKEIIDNRKELIDLKFIEGDTIEPQLQMTEIQRMGKEVYNKLYQVLIPYYTLKL